MRKQENPCYGLLIIAVIFLTSCVAAQSDAKIKTLCEENDGSCKQCISAHPMCSWCGDLDDETLTEPIKRCTLHSQNLVSCTRSGSSNVTVINPASHLEVEQNQPFTDAGPDFFDNDTNIGKTVVQTRPQNITVKLRKDQPYKVNVTFRKVIDYPLDIYYVMDLSYSMNDDLKLLQKLGTSLFEDLKTNVTKNVQLGFGSFVDKVMMPYASTVDEQLDNPCASQPNTNTTCATPFGFRHQVSITGNATAFNEAIQSTEISGNIDIPEGSFDALMQIAVCEHIKWRDGATRVILLTTDATPHVAMDGKLAAILEANDMKCHLKKGANTRLPEAIVYAKSKTMDYPSLGQLKGAFDSNKIHSIFAVTADVLDLYQGIDKILSDAYLAELQTDSGNIIPLINQTYSKLKGNIEFKTSPSLPPHVKQTHKIFCPIFANNTKDEMKCQGIEIGDEVVIEFEFTAMECPSDPNHRDQILLTSSSLRDVVTINLEYLCECDCQTEGLANNSDCNYSGSLTCGVCMCDEGKEGSLCQCDAMMANGVSVKDSCKKDPGSDKYCEDRGFCDCGKCKHCEAPYTGDHCECTTAGCPSTEDGVCGGPKQGYCKYCPGSSEDRCRCYAPYSIKTSDGTCSCDPAKCKISPTSSICDGHGECECDTCKCNKTIWSGSYCQNCVDPNCVGVNATCKGEVIRKCALCLTKSDDCGEVCNIRTDVLLYEKRPKFLDCDSCLPSSTERDCKECRKHNTSVEKKECSHTRENDSCKYDYQIVWTKQHQYYVYVNIYDNKRDCPADNSLIFAFSGVGAFILIVIVALVIWKVYTRIRDKRLYEAFEEEQKRRKWTKGENPIFERPEQKFANPMFDANDIDG